MEWPRRSEIGPASKVSALNYLVVAYEYRSVDPTTMGTKVGLAPGTDYDSPELRCKEEISGAGATARGKPRLIDPTSVRVAVRTVEDCMKGKVAESLQADANLGKRGYLRYRQEATE